jgi:tetratricopeptide (TPR) repeat protein
MDDNVIRGIQALEEANFAEALKAFKTAAASESKSGQGMALHGMGLAQYHAKDKNSGIATLEKALSASPNRAIVHNVAIVHLKTNPMRSAKFLRDWLSRKDAPLDEPLQNVLGVALSNAGSTEARKGQMFVDTRKFYADYDLKLAIDHGGGLKRWGVNWIHAETADKNWKQAMDRSREVDALDKDVAKAVYRSKKAHEKLGDLHRSFGLNPEWKYRAAQRGLSEAVASQRALEQQLSKAQAAFKNTEMPVFPADLTFIPIDALTPESHPKQYAASGPR